MNIEQFNLTPEKKETSRRLLFAVEANLKPLIGRINVSGKEHLQELVKGEKVVIATTHLSDLDIPLVVKALGKDFDMAVSDLSTNHEFFTNPRANLGIKLAGESNFLPIDYQRKGGRLEAKFNPDNFAAMAEALDNKKEVVVSAHNPSPNGRLTKAGVGAVYLSQLAKAVILPVAVNVKSNQPFQAGKNFLKSLQERPDADVIVGSPLKLEAIEGIERMEEIFDKRQRGERLSQEEREEFKKLSSLLKEQANALIKILAAMLPQEKRGPYSEI